MRGNILLIGVLVLFCASLEAATYYMSPTGNDAAAGTAVSTPWKTFAYAVPKLRPGDVLTLLDGVYNETNSGFVVLENVNGTATQPITIKAQNERKAHIHNNGSTNSVYLKNSSFLNFEGLQLSSADNSNFLYPNSRGGGMQVADCHHLVLKRLVVHHNNRYGNVHLVTWERVHYSLIEESEFYYFHRHAVAMSGNDNTFRRLYFHSRAYGNIPGGYNNNATWVGGVTGVTIYPGSRNILENCIMDSTGGSVFDINAVNSADDNKFLGNIAYKVYRGGDIRTRSVEAGFTAISVPKNNIVRDFVTYGAASFGLAVLGVRGQRVDNCTFLNNGHSGIGASVSILNGKPEGDGVYSVYSDNTLAMGNGSAAYAGIWVNTDYYKTWTIRHSNAVNNLRGNYDPASSPNYVGAQSVDPKMGTCIVYIPDNSPMKRAGLNGADIGANILYRYENGTLTNKPLWDPQTGAFPHGAVVSGLNDIAGQSLFDVHKRLNVNCNSCPFPAGYPKTSSITSAPANAVTSPVQGLLAITPNYAGTSISITTSRSYPATVEVFNLQGKKVEQFKNVQASGIQWQRGNLPAGVYFVKASSKGITANAKVFLGK